MTGEGQGGVSCSGTVSRVIYYNPGNDFGVIQIEVSDDSSQITVVGKMPELMVADPIAVSGKWTSHPRFGKQIAAHSIIPDTPNTLSGLRAYLESSAVEGIGKVHASRLVDKFGDELFDVLDHSPHRLKEVPGIGRKRERLIRESWKRNQVSRDIMVYLHGLGLGPAMAANILREYGNDAATVVARNPFRLIRDIRGMGFKTADSMASRAGVAKDHPERIVAGIRHLMDEVRLNGSCGIAQTDLADRAVKLLEVESGLIGDGMGSLIRAGDLVHSLREGVSYMYPVDLFVAEAEIAARIRNIANGPVPWRGLNPDEAIRKAESCGSMRFGDSQTHAIRTAVSSKFTVITGGPGVGKTTIVNAILRILAGHNDGFMVRICAPTGRAAKRVSELTGYEAMTIHRMLEINPDTGAFRYNAENPIDCGLLVVDESSMIDVMLMRSLLEAVPDDAAIVMVGDADQLPSVGPGRVLADVMESNEIKVVKLTEIYRQGEKSRVVENAHKINSGRLPDLSRPAGESDFYFQPVASPTDAVNLILKLVAERIPKRFGFDPVKDVQVLCPMNRGEVSVQSLNARLKEVLNPAALDDRKSEGTGFSPGDKVMQIRNDNSKGIFNGDIGFVMDVVEEEDSLLVQFDGRDLMIGPEDIDGLMPAYAVTVHKSQGSEFPAVVVPILNQHWVMLKRNLLYTAVTRARELLVLIGQQRAIEIAVRTDDQERRVTRLGSLLQETSAF